MRIAILQNRVGVGGRSKVVSEVLKVLNQEGIVPHLLSFSVPRDLSRFREAYGTHEDLRFRSASPMAFALRRGTAYQMLALNLLTRRLLRKYDWVFNSNNCPYLLPRGPKYIHYVHHPPEALLMNTERYNSGWKWRVYVAPLKLLYGHLQVETERAVFLCNSRFTKREVVELYQPGGSAVEVAYPPAIEKVHIRRKSVEMDRVVSLGSFAPDKRQLEQIEIASRLPAFDFRIVGRVKSRRYFRSCCRAVQALAAENVTLLPDLDSSLVRQELAQAGIFLHTKSREPFGISTAEAISYGCLPVVPNSGGQMEIVPMQELRFNSLTEATERISWLARLDLCQRLRYSDCLQEHVEEYAVRVFREAIRRQFTMKSGMVQSSLSH